MAGLVVQSMVRRLGGLVRWPLRLRARAPDPAGWTEMVQHVATAYRLDRYRVEGAASAFSDSAEGIYDAMHIELAIDIAARGRRPMIELGVEAAIDDALELGSPQRLSNPPDPSARTPIGVHRFDARVAVFRATRRTLAELREDVAWRDELAALVGVGFTLASGRARVRTSQFPRSAAELATDVERVLDVCRRLTALQPGS